MGFARSLESKLTKKLSSAEIDTLIDDFFKELDHLQEFSELGKLRSPGTLRSSDGTQIDRGNYHEAIHRNVKALLKESGLNQWDLRQLLWKRLPSTPGYDSSSNTVLWLSIMMLSYPLK